MTWAPSGWFKIALNVVVAGVAVFAATNSWEAAVAAVLTNIAGLLQKRPHD